MSKSRMRRIVYEGKPGTGNEIEFLTFSKQERPDRFRRLLPGSDAEFEQSDLLAIKSSFHTNYEIRSFNGLLLIPVQVNNLHPDYKGETITVYDMKSLNGTREDDSDGDVVVSNPQNPFP